NDSYGGDVNTFGSCNPLYSEDTESTAFFFDFGGRDAYPKGRMANDAKWGERAFGVGLDEDVREPERGKQPWWEPAGLPEGAASAAGFASASPLVRFAAQSGLADPARGGIDALLAVASGGHAFARRDLIDAVRQWLNAKKLSAAGADRLLPLLSSPDKDLRLLALFAWMSLKSMGPEAVREAGKIAQFDASPDVRGVACLALGKSGSKEAMPFLLQALKASNPSVRRRAAIGLSDLKAPEAMDDLLAVLALDPEPDPRAHAADALGALRDPRALPALRAALLDRDGLVRFYAARALLKDFGRAEAMEHMIGLARWDAGALRDQLVWGFLKAYAGKELAGTEAAWKAWWAEAGKDFDAGRAGQVYARCVDAEEAARQGDPEKAIGIYREIRKLDPRHAGACEEVSKALNSRAWEIAVSGKDYAEGLKLAEEAADAKADPDIVDTLAVLQYLTGDRKKAEETVRKALETVKGDKAEMLVRRLEEFKTGKLELH
ncbi:MAG: HEAT repeat domain-containing protein, partial [Planctomycetes bacterium]|nr:HEAT repeat domain-containing protein [Planctomycetota bacterium]